MGVATAIAAGAAVVGAAASVKSSSDNKKAQDKALKQNKEIADANGFKQGFMEGYDDQYAYAQDKWTKQRDEEYAQMSGLQSGQLQRTQDLLDQIKTMSDPYYDEMSQETAYREYRDKLAGDADHIRDYQDSITDFLTQLNTERGGLTTQQNKLNEWTDQMWNTDANPAFKQRADEMEHQRLRDYQEDIGRLGKMNERQIARTGNGIWSPERKDEQIGRLLQQKQDTARDESRKTILDDLARVIATGQTNLAGAQKNVSLGNEQANLNVGNANSMLGGLNSGIALGGQYKDVAESQRAREMAGLQSDVTNLMSKETANQAYENALYDLLQKYRENEPDYYDIKNQYKYQSSGIMGAPQATGNSAAGTANLIGSVANFAKTLGDVYTTWKGTQTPTMPTSPAMTNAYDVSTTMPTTGFDTTSQGSWAYV